MWPDWKPSWTSLWKTWSLPITPLWGWASWGPECLTRRYRRQKGNHTALTFILDPCLNTFWQSVQLPYSTAHCFENVLKVLFLGFVFKIEFIQVSMSRNDHMPHFLRLLLLDCLNVVNCDCHFSITTLCFSLTVLCFTQMQIQCSQIYLTNKWKLCPQGGDIVLVHYSAAVRLDWDQGKYSYVLPD